MTILLRRRSGASIPEFTASLWLDAADSSSFTLVDTDRVAQWDDKSGNNNHVTQTVAASRPTRVTNGVAFESVGTGTRVVPAECQYLAVEVQTMGVMPFTVFAVFDNVNNKVNPSQGMAVVGGNVTLTSYATMHATNTGVGVTHRNTTFREIITTSGVNVAPGRNLAIARWLSSTSRSIVANEGTVATTIAGSVQIGTAGRTLVGTERIPATSWPASPFNGIMREIIVLPSSPDATLTADIKNYLNGKWHAY